MEQIDQQFKIDHVALENYLLSMKDSIQMLTEEIRHPVWWDSLKNDVDKVVELGRKVDHNQIDINSLRSILYGKNLSSINNSKDFSNKSIKYNNTDNNQSAKNSSEDIEILNDTENIINNKSSYKLNESEIYKDIPNFPIQFICAEIEGMRLLLRRIEKHQSSDVQLFGQVKHLQSQMRNMLRIYDPKLAEQGLTNIRNEVTQQIHNVKLLIKQTNEIQPLSETLEDRLNLIEENILNVNKNNKLLQNKESKGINSEVQEILLKIQKKQTLYEQDFQLFKKRIKNTDQIKSSRILFKIFIKYHTNKIKVFFKIWSNILLQDKKKMIISENVPSEFNDIVTKYDVLRLKQILKNWQYAIFKKEEDKRHYILKKRILNKWHSKSIPNINPYFKHWKRFSVVTRKRVNLNLKINEKENPIDSLKSKFEDLEQDFEGRMMLIQNYTLKLLDNKDANETKLNNIASSMLNFVSSDQMNCNIKSFFEDSLVLFENQIVKVSKSSDAKMTRERDYFERKLRDTTDKVEENINEFKKLKIFVNSFGDRFDAQDKKIERILLLQGNILERIEKVEDLQANFMGSKTGFTDLIKDVKAVRSEIVDVAEQISNTQNYFQEEIDKVDTKSNKNNENIHGLSNYNKTIISDFKILETNLQSRMKGLEHSLKHRLPPNPTPDELYSIAYIYETKYIQKNKEGKYTDIMNLQIADKLSKFTHRLSSYIANTVDMEIISSIIIKCGEESGAEVNIKDSRKNFVLLKRKEMVDIFLNNFTNIVNSSDKTGPPGILKLNARTIFLRQFKKALDISFSKLEIIQVSNPVPIVCTNIGLDTNILQFNYSNKTKYASSQQTNNDIINSNKDNSSNPNLIKYLHDFQNNFSAILSMLPKTSENTVLENYVTSNKNQINDNKNEGINNEIKDKNNDLLSNNAISEISNTIFNSNERNDVTTQTTSSLINESTKENNNYNDTSMSRQNSLENFSFNNSSTNFNEMVANMILLDYEIKPDLLKSKRASSAGSFRVKDAHLIKSRKNIIGEANLTEGDEIVVKRRIISKKFSQIN